MSLKLQFWNHFHISQGPMSKWHCAKHVSVINSLRPSDASMCQQTKQHWSDNGLLPGWHQAIIWTNAGILSIHRNKLQWNLKRNLYIFIQENAVENVVCQTAAILSRLQCVKLKVENWGHNMWQTAQNASTAPYRTGHVITDMVKATLIPLITSMIISALT